MTKLSDQLTPRQQEWLKDGAVTVEFVREGDHAGMFMAVGRTARMRGFGRTPRLAIEALREPSTA